MADDPTLCQEARTAIADPASIVHVSAASLWEIAIKRALGKIEIEVESSDLLSELPANDLAELPISGRHALAAGSLPRHHDDPFDRMLIAQAMVESLVLVTRDGAMADYSVPTLPA